MGSDTEVVLIGVGGWREGESSTATRTDGASENLGLGGGSSLCCAPSCACGVLWVLRGK